MTKCTTEVPQNDLECPIFPNLQLFQSFSTNVAQDNLERPILPDLQLFQSFPTGVAQNGQFCPIYNFSNLFPLKWLRMTQNDSEWPILHGKTKKNTMIQGNFYERLHFYMNSCAISPTASLLKVVSVKKNSEMLRTLDSNTLIL